MKNSSPSWTLRVLTQDRSNKSQTDTVQDQHHIKLNTLHNETQQGLRETGANVPSWTIILNSSNVHMQITHTHDRKPNSINPFQWSWSSSKSAANRAQHIRSPSHTHTRTRVHRNTHRFSILSIRATVYLAGGRHCILRPLTERQKLRFTHTHTHACSSSSGDALRWLMRERALALPHIDTRTRPNVRTHARIATHPCLSIHSITPARSVHTCGALSSPPPSLPAVRKTWKQPVPVNEPDAAIHRA